MSRMMIFPLIVNSDRVLRSSLWRIEVNVRLARFSPAARGLPRVTAWREVKDVQFRFRRAEILRHPVVGSPRMRCDVNCRTIRSERQLSHLLQSAHSSGSERRIFHFVQCPWGSWPHRSCKITSLTACTMNAVANRQSGGISPARSEKVFGAAYISKASRFVGPQQTSSIVTHSRIRNKADALSGFLVRAGRNFLQYLEGPQCQVTACLRRIETDPRHYDMRILAVGSMNARRFSDWSMGYFVGDRDGCERFEQSLTEWRGTDQSLLEEVWRIAAAAHTGVSVNSPELIAGPFEVLLRRCG